MVQHFSEWFIPCPKLFKTIQHIFRLEKSIFWWALNFGNTHLLKKTQNYHQFKIAKNSVNQIFNPHAFFFFLLTGSTWYYHAIYIVLKCFASFTGYEDDIFEGISNFNIQGCKFGGKFANLAENLQIWRKVFFKIELRGVHGVCFFLVLV